MVALYRNDGAAGSPMSPKAAGLIRLGWASGVCVADYDNDGFEDVYVTAFGPNVLWRNIGGSTVRRDRTGRGSRLEHRLRVRRLRPRRLRGPVRRQLRQVRARQGARARSAACRFMNIAMYCGPRPLARRAGSAVSQHGNGTFVDVTKAAGVTEPGYYGFGVLFTDLDDDGWPDIYVANDSTPNLFFRNQRNGRFSEEALEAGLAVSADGREQAGMGVDAGDVDGDGLLDLVKTNFSQDYTSLYRNEGGGLFVDASFRSGLAATLGPYLGWGVGFVDLDNDGLLDLFIANGHVYPDVARTGTSSYRQRNQVFRNVGRGRLRHDHRGGGRSAAAREIEPRRGVRRLRQRRRHRCADLGARRSSDAAAQRHDREPLDHDALEGTKSNRSAIGAKVTIEAGGRRQVAEVRSGGSYLSHNDMRVRFGLGDADDRGPALDSLAARRQRNAKRWRLTASTPRARARGVNLRRRCSPSR